MHLGMSVHNTYRQAAFFQFRGSLGAQTTQIQVLKSRSVFSIILPAPFKVQVVVVEPIPNSAVGDVGVGNKNRNSPGGLRLERIRFNPCL